VSIYKRGEVYWYKFMWQGRMVRESTKQGNDKVARQMEAAHRTSLAKGEVGIRDKKTVPTLAEFGEKRFAPWAQSATCEKTWLDYYRPGLRIIGKYKPLASLRLDQITSERASDFAAWRQAQGLQVSSVNSSLQVSNASFISQLRGAPLRKRPRLSYCRGNVVGEEEEARYLAAASELLAPIATLLADTGMRPDECYRLRWEAITWINGRNGTLLVTHGKTAAARRVLPMTPRVRALLQARWEERGRPLEGWIWPALTRKGHVDRSSLKKQHKQALRVSGVRPFVLYSLRHTFLTRLGASGCDAWTLARIAGHSSVAISARYVHPSEATVLEAVERLGGHEIGHSLEIGAGATCGTDSLTLLLPSR